MESLLGEVECSQVLRLRTTFEPRSEMLSKVSVLDGAVMKKSKKHHAGASPESPSTVKNNKFEPFGIHPRIQRIQRIRCQDPRLGTTLPRAPGVRMT